MIMECPFCSRFNDTTLIDRITNNYSQSYFRKNLRTTVCPRCQNIYCSFREKEYNTQYGKYITTFTRDAALKIDKTFEKQKPYYDMPDGEFKDQYKDYYKGLEETKEKMESINERIKDTQEQIEQSGSDKRQKKYLEEQLKQHNQEKEREIMNKSEELKDLLKTFAKKEFFEPQNIKKDKITEKDLQEVISGINHKRINKAVGTNISKKLNSLQGMINDHLEDGKDPAKANKAIKASNVLFKTMYSLQKDTQGLPPKKVKPTKKNVVSSTIKKYIDQSL